MGTLTASEMCDEIRLHLGDKSVADWPNAARCERRLNESLMHLASPRVYRHKELEVEHTTAIVASQSTYTIDLGSVRTLAIDSLVLASPTNSLDRWRLHPIRERHGHVVSGRYSPERPRMYSVWGANQFEVFPEPSSQYAGWTLSLRRIAMPTLFDLTVSPTAVSPLHEVWDEVLVLGAVWRSWRMLKEWKLAEATKAETGQLINEIADRMSVEAEDFDHIVDMHQPLFD